MFPDNVDNQLPLVSSALRNDLAAAVGPATVTPELSKLARKLPPAIHLGTSSWYFPGWAGIVFDRKVGIQTVRREGLRAYGQHPLLRTVGIDRTFYAPIPAAEFARYAEQVPDGFHFLVKAPKVFLTPPRGGEHDGPDANSPHFLDATGATKKFVAPCLEGLGEKAGPLVFQFSPLGKVITNAPQEFAQALNRFLSSLPNGPLYAVELRDAALFTQDYVEALRAAGAHHCVSVHPRMPDVSTQAQFVMPSMDAPLVVRWNLHGGFNYKDAKDRYAPFDRLVDEDSDNRTALAKLCARSHRAGQAAYVIINNKAEGSAPLSVFKLAAAIVNELGARGPD
ncbi:MAG: DUF72 domain-containing protein [Pseudomonadota bacterium]|nr:DUF72 domain-containing protein [Pseudomonadota bacterium]